jgi:prepilin-type N-terminal cleavage/methylation domain-containing protein
MAARVSRIRGFTLIELMITLAVIVVLMIVAIPSFQAYRQRATLRAVTEQTLGLWQQARFEAAKRNTYVRFGVAGGGTCIGAATQALVNGTDIPTSANTSACDCTGADNTNLCDIFAYPANSSEWQGATINGTPTLGNNLGIAVLEPKNATLTASSDAGAIRFAGPPGPQGYRINLRVDAMGRGVLCQSSSSPKPLSDYATRICSP